MPPKPIRFTLNQLLQDLATLHGTRNFHSRKHLTHSWNRTDLPTVQDAITETGAEIACGQIINRPWKPNKSYEEDKAGDLGPGIQVRHTKRRFGQLLLHPIPDGGDRDRDDPSHRFYLVTGLFPTFLCHGSIMCWRALELFPTLRIELQKGRPALVINQRLLDPIDLLNPGPTPKPQPKKNWTTPRVTQKIIFSPASDYCVQSIFPFDLFSQTPQIPRQ